MAEKKNRHERFNSEDAKNRLTSEYDKRKEEKEKRTFGLDRIYWLLGICMYICAVLVVVFRHEVQGAVFLAALGVIFTMLGRHLENKKK